MAERLKTPGDAARLGARLRSARTDRGLTLIQLAELTGVDAGQLSKLERGQMATLSTNVRKICTYLEITPDPGDPPPTRAGRLLDELVASLPGSERAVVKLVTAIQEVVMNVATHAEHKKAN